MVCKHRQAFLTSSRGILQESFMRQYQLFINGEFLSNANRKLIDVINPATGETVKTYDEMSEGTSNAAWPPPRRRTKATA